MFHFGFLGRVWEEIWGQCVGRDYLKGFYCNEACLSEGPFTLPIALASVLAVVAIIVKEGSRGGGMAVILIIIINVNIYYHYAQ